MSDTAKAFALERHGEQVDKSGAPYGEHLARVALAVTPLGSAAIQVAWLHDVLEDTPTTEAQLRVRFDTVVCDAVVTLTRRATETYADYIKRVAARGGLAVDVKLADLADHLRPGHMIASLENRYMRAVAQLRASHEGVAK